MSLCVSLPACVCVCVCEREREREMSEGVRILLRVITIVYDVPGKQYCSWFCKFRYGVASRTAAVRIICLMLLIRTAALCTVITHWPLCRAADNQSKYLIYIT